VTKIIFGFDVGLGSLGEAVRQGSEIVHADSLLIDAKVATIADQAGIRRAYRTRKTHKEREKWWQKVWESIGKVPLKGIEVSQDEKGNWDAKTKSGDERLEREFAKKGDDTVYTSCLLRIKLLQGKQLEDWQIYKAIRSAFQRAGYPHVPWERMADKEEIERVNDFTEKLEKIFPNPSHRFPCYYDAFQMKLFDPQTGEITTKQNHTAERARGYTAPRDLVGKELRQLLTQAAKQIPELKNMPAKNWQEYILFGPDEVAFNDTKIEGILDQKRAKFDNRCVNSCSILPQLKVTRAENILYFQTHFLKKLCDMKVEKNKENLPLTPEERQEWYETAEAERKTYMAEFFAKGEKKLKEDDYEKIAKKYKVTKTQWKTWCERKDYKVHPGTCEIAAPKTSGRTGFSRPAMLLVRDLILSGMGPHDFRKKLLAEDFGKYKKFKLEEKDLHFLLRMKGNDPQNIYLSPQTLLQQYGDETGDLELAIKRYIGTTRNSVVRHRLSVFFQRLQKLQEEYGTPEQIVIEFAREDFSSKDSKKKYENMSKENNKLFEDAKKKLRDEFGIDYRQQNEKLVRKYMMWEKQGHICPYTGEPLCFSKLPEYQVEHIIPQKGKWQGPDDIKNTVLTTQTENLRKGDKMPFEYISDEEWGAFQNRVNDMNISGKTKNILLARTEEEVEKLIDRYYGIAVTSLVARMVRDIACLWFGWQPGAEGEGRKLHTVSGSLVGKVRRIFHLNKALNPFLSEADAKKDKKNRDDKRHHALDAMVMTYLDEYMRNPRNFPKLFKELGDTFGELGGYHYFEEKLEEVVPHKIARNKAALGETAYRVIEQQKVVEKKGKKEVKKETILVGRVPLFTIEKGKIKVADPKKIIDPNISEQVSNFLRDNPTEEEKKEFFETLGIKKVQVKKGSPDNLENLSKNTKARGQYYESKSITGTGTLQHGVYLYSRDEEIWKVKPVYAFLSPYKEKKKLLEQGYCVKDNVLFYPGCIIEVTENIEGKDVDRGRYTVKTIKSGGSIKLQNSKGDIFRFALSLLKNNFHFVQ
jgi:CRISPR-associated endonuclease Csn1